MPTQIMKRDGRLETWSTERIAQAIFKALSASRIKDPLMAKRMARKVEAKLEGVDIPEQEHVQNMVEEVLMDSRLHSVAKNSSSTATAAADSEIRKTPISISKKPLTSTLKK